MTVCYYPWIILFQMTSPQQPALVSTVGTDDTSLSESIIIIPRSICGDPRISEVTGSVTYSLAGYYSN